MATAPAAPVAPIAATASVSTTPVLRLVAVGEPVVRPLAVQWWNQVPWIDRHNGWPLYWGADDRPANAKSWVTNPAVTQKMAGKLVVELSLAPGATLDAQPRQGWDVPVVAKASSTLRTLTEVLRVQGQVATTAHVPASTPRILEHDVLDAERGTRLVPSMSSSGILWLPRPAVGYVVVEYSARMVTLEAEFGITTAPWTAEIRERVLGALIFEKDGIDYAKPPAYGFWLLPPDDERTLSDGTPMLMLKLDVRDPETRKTQSEIVASPMKLTGSQNYFGPPQGNQRDAPRDDAAEPDELVYTEIGRTVQQVRVESQQTPGVWVDVDVASQIVMSRDGGSQLMVLNFEVPT